MTLNAASLVSDYLDVWTNAAQRKSGAGNGRDKHSFYGIERLRDLILELGVTGKLVPQDDSEPCANTLLEQIEAEKCRLYKLGAAKRLKPVEAPDTWPFSIPHNWVWSQIGVITNYGETDKVNPGEVSDDTWVLELEDVEKRSSRLLTRVRHSDRNFQSQKNRFRTGDVIYGKLRPYLDKVLVADEDGVCTTEMVPVRGYFGVEPGYLRLYLKSPYFINLADNSTHGMNLPRLGTERARAAPIALPPTAEQKRIVAKVDELMALCDTLEEESAEALSAHHKLVEALLAALIDSPDATDVVTNWTRLEEHFDLLFTTEASVDALQRSILELAVHGKLVAQDESEEPASALIERWEEAKQHSLENNGDRRIKVVPKPKVPPFDVPAHWEFQSFENIFLFIDYRGNTPPKTESGIPLITAKNVRMGYLDREPREFIANETFARWMTRGFPKLGDLFLTTEAPLGNICLNDIEEPFAIAQRLICFQPYGPTNTRFFMQVIMSQSMQRVLDNSATGMTARGIKAAKLKPISLPVPPEAEQQRIVAKVDELMALCDRLKARIADAAATQTQLADSAIERLAA